MSSEDDGATPGLRYLSADDVAAAMPPIDERLALAEKTMVALASGAELPAKIGVHPRPPDSFGHAMPAHLRGADDSGSEDLVGMKWIAGFPDNRSKGLPAIHGLVLIADPTTGVPAAILDAGPITAERTAAISGIAIQRWAPPVAGRPMRAGLVGAGVQGRSHLAVIGRVLPGVAIRVYDRHPDRAAALAATARATAGIAEATTAASARDAVSEADVVVTAASFGPVRQVMTSDWLSPDALVVPVDYATYCAAEVAAGAALFLVDHREQFLANRDAGAFEGYRDPMATIGEAIIAGRQRPEHGRVVVTHLGVGLADLVFGAAILRRAVERGLGTVLSA
jgi:ornithine cyclodeaminase/alanine dehydrogenase-like protein (mu-crystallin family)